MSTDTAGNAALGGLPADHAATESTGVAVVAGRPDDVGQTIDTGQTIDSGQTIDAGQATSAGQAIDAGRAIDPGRAIDAAAGGSSRRLQITVAVLVVTLGFAPIAIFPRNGVIYAGIATATPTLYTYTIVLGAILIAPMSPGRLWPGAVALVAGVALVGHAHHVGVGEHAAGVVRRASVDSRCGRFRTRGGDRVPRQGLVVAAMGLRSSRLS